MSVVTRVWFYPNIENQNMLAKIAEGIQGFYEKA